MREKMEDEERSRAISDAMRMMEDETEGRDEKDMEREQEMVNAADNSSDVHFQNFNLANRKGGGADLLADASLTLTGGRRYGLMGRNGCGKTTLLTALAARELGGIGGGIPKNMSMLLVRQEIMGNDLSAVQSVLKSDVKREGVKRWIQYIETELNKLDDPNYGNEQQSNSKKDGDAPAVSKGKQKLKDRKKSTAVTIKKSSTNTNKFSEEEVEGKRKRLTAKLSTAYERLARIEQEEGGDPEPRARKVLFGLGFTTPEMQDKPTKELSGGWRMRVSLSCALFANPALLLLDGELFLST
jgi:ATP-binding cassette subfamily F protein 3